MTGFAALVLACTLLALPAILASNPRPVIISQNVKRAVGARTLRFTGEPNWTR
jgi:hypothetical protein